MIRSKSYAMGTQRFDNGFYNVLQTYVFPTETEGHLARPGTI